MAEYLLANSSAELERLTLQARVWQHEAEIMLDQIGIQQGWRAIDLGCGAMGLLEPLSRRVGLEGEVYGIDIDKKQLVFAASMYENLSNVHLLEQDLFDTNFPGGDFDFAHARFEFAPIGRNEELLTQMMRLAKTGGILAIEEPDSASWLCYPPHESWLKLKDAILKAFQLGGGNFNVGTRIYGMMQEAGLQDVHIRASVLALQDCHPYMRSPLQFATSLRSRIIDYGLMSAEELNRVIADVEKIVNDPATVVTTFIVNQVWGRKPA